MEREIGTVGLPRAMLYHRCGRLWECFFSELGIRTVISPQSNRALLEQGSALAIDESCLSFKLFLGHVEALIGKCDAIFIPRYSNYGRDTVFCTRFEGLYDQTRNIFRGSDQRFLSCNIDVQEGKTEESAFLSLGKELGFGVKETRSAWNTAVKTFRQEQQALLKTQAEKLKKPGLKVLVAGHSYILSDAYVGRPIFQAMEQMDVIPLRGDLVDRAAALRMSARFSPTLRWITNRELIGSVLLQEKDVDGIILVSAFPCGPDAMVNDLLIRRLKDKPILNLVMDGQSGTVGMETRLESFVDILRFQKGDVV